ncbi:hypothetical protein STEG23_027946 [Scotinomys teguina]
MKKLEKSHINDLTAHLKALEQEELTFGPFDTTLSEQGRLSSLYQVAPKDTSLTLGIVSLMLHFHWNWVGLFIIDDDKGNIFDMAMSEESYNVYNAVYAVAHGLHEMILHQVQLQTREKGKEMPFFPWQQKDGSCFHIHSVNLCLFIGFLYLDEYFLILVGKIFFNDFVEYIFCAFELVFFSFFYPYFSKFRPFQGFPDFLDILSYNLFEFGVFLDC